MKDWQAQLETDGYALLPDFAASAEIDDLIEAIESSRCSIGSTLSERESFAIRDLLQVVPAVGEWAASPSVRNFMHSLLEKEARVVRGILFDKTPGANWKVPWHQDLTIAVQQQHDAPGFGPWSIKAGIPHVQPPMEVLQRMVTLRLHLDECDAGNGPLRVLPGTHRHGRLSSEAIAERRGLASEVLCTTPRGGALLMKPLLLHASSPCQSPRHRRVVHLEWSADILPHGLQWHTVS
jgi:ectoine hydroxylase-related dioxygenase (phytanoyl-CoA dioxygenase family)